MKYLKLIFLLALFIGIFTTAINADVVMTSTQENYDGEEEITVKTYIGPKAVRTEAVGTDTDHIFIFREDKDLYWVIDNKKKTYMEITGEDMKKINQQMEQARKAYEEQMKNLPPEQRKMIEKMMKDKMPTSVPEIEYKKIGSGVKVNHWTCDRYDGYSDGVKVEEVWTVDWKNLGLSPEDFSVLLSMSNFFRKFPQAGFKFIKVSSEKEVKTGYPGIPVKMIDYSDGKKKSKMEIVKIEKKDVEYSLFELPGGLKKKSNPWEKR